MDVDSAYDAPRAAALAGVPRSTLHAWARRGLVPPSVSPGGVKLWSYGDLLRVRIIHWLRMPKQVQGSAISGTSLRNIERAFAELRASEMPLWSADETSNLRVSSTGEVILRGKDGLWSRLTGQMVMDDLLDPIAPFSGWPGLVGPDLVHPRPLLRIQPGKLSGEPHIDSSRVETLAVAALSGSGLTNDAILELYPQLSADQIAQAIELEAQLARNAAFAAAA